MLKFTNHKTIQFVLLTVAFSLNARAAIYNATTDMSITNGNPNGVWTYGYSEDLDLADFSANFTAMTFTAGPNSFGIGWSKDLFEPHVSLNTSVTTQYGVPPGMLTQHPGSAHQPSLIRFTAPEHVNATFSGEYFAGDFGIMSLVILVNGTPVWTATDAGTFNLNTTLLAGGTIDFGVYGGYTAGNTPISLSISTTPVPEPAQFATTGGIVLLGFVAIRRTTKAGRTSRWR